MNKVLELSSKSSKGGRRKIKMVLLTLHSKDETNLNGISWNEEYVSNNLDSIKGIPICASFVDDERSIPFDHGYTETVEIENGKSEPLFNNSECCGVIEDAKIEDLEINGETKRVLVGYGYLFYQRYKKFCDYIKENISTSEVKSSIEIVGKDGGAIVYDGGYNENLRYPQIFDFSATAILGVKEADENCYVLEVAQKQENKKEENKNMEFTIDDIKTTIQATITELNNKESELNQTISELNEQLTSKDSEIAEKDSTISELNASIEKLNKALDDLRKEHDTYWEERRVLEEELVKAKVAERLRELDSELEEFSEEEKELASENIEKLKTDISACKKKEELNDVSTEINSIKTEIFAKIGQKAKEKEAQKISEQNASKEEEVKIEDIFSEVCEEEIEEGNEEVDIFA